MRLLATNSDASLATYISCDSGAVVAVPVGVGLAAMVGCRAVTQTHHRLARADGKSGSRQVPEAPPIPHRRQKEQMSSSPQAALLSMSRADASVSAYPEPVCPLSATFTACEINPRRSGKIWRAQRGVDVIQAALNGHVLRATITAMST